MHVMLDLETMGNGHDATITQIGAVAFDPETGAMGAEFSGHVTLASAVREGLRIDASCVLWWLEQDEAARKALLAGQHGARPLPEVLKEFRRWITPMNPDGVWSHGSTFDLPILSHAYRTLELNPGWGFRVARDTRTLFWLCAPLDPWVEEAQPGEVKHVAVDDARRQARAVIRAIAHLRSGPRAAPLEPEQPR